MKLNNANKKNKDCEIEVKELIKNKIVICH